MRREFVFFFFTFIMGNLKYIKKVVVSIISCIGQGSLEHRTNYTYMRFYITDCVIYITNYI